MPDITPYSFLNAGGTVPLYNPWSVDLDGANERIGASAIPALTFQRTDPFTISIWAKWTHTSNDAMISNAFSSGTYRGYYIVANSGKVVFQLKNNATRYIEVETNTTTYNDGNWHHIVATYTGTSTAAGVTIYIDGSAVATTTTKDTLTTGNTNANALFNLGARNGSNLFWDGKLNQASIFTGSFNTSEVTELRDGTGPAIIAATHSRWGDVLGYWPCATDADDLTATSGQVEDQSGNAYHLTPKATEVADKNADVPI